MSWSSPGHVPGHVAWDRGASPWASSGHEVRTEPLCGMARADVAVVGGGFSGLSAAYHLVRQDPRRRVILLEAARIPGGASGLNTGMAGPGVQGSIQALVRAHGRERAAAAFEATLDAVGDTIELIRSEKLDCELEVTGQLKVATTAQQAASLRAQARLLQELGFDLPYRSGCEVAARLRTRAYCGALELPGALLNPARVCHELARVLRERGVRVCEASPVRAVRSSPHDVTLSLDRGEVRAQRVILATNGYVARLGLLRGQVWPLHTHLVRTEPLEPAQLDALGWKGREAIVDARTCFNYYRLTASGQIVFGGAAPHYARDPRDAHAGAHHAESPSAFARLERELRALFPVLERVRVADRWSGMMGFTIDQLPLITWLDRRVLYVGGWSGHGVALALASGATVADLIAGRSTARTRVPWVRSAAPVLPPDPVRGLGIRTYVRGLDLMDRAGSLADRWLRRVTGSHEDVTRALRTRALGLSRGGSS